MMSASEVLEQLSHKYWRKETEDGDSVIWAGPETKGREMVSHFSCAWSPFPPGRKHGDSSQCHIYLNWRFRTASHYKYK